MASKPVTFGPFAFDPGRGELRRDGEPVALGHRAAALLGALLEAGGGAVGKQELLDRAWPATVVEEGNLTVQIAALRKQLGPAPDGRGWIATVPRIGYRLAVPRHDPEEDAAIRRPSLAVLPFDCPGGDTAGSWFADGVVAEIITALARFRSFGVASRNSSFAYKGMAVDVRRVARDLGVRYVLEGSVRRAGGRLRINMQLVDGETGTHLCAEQFEGAASDVFAFQDRITARVATLVEPAIETAEIERSRRERPRSVAVHDRYLRALSLLTDETVEANAAAFALLTDALVIEPDNAVLLAHAAWALEHRSTMGWPPIGPDDRGRCIDLARRGLRHAAGDPRLMAQCGMALVQTGKDYDGGMAIIEAAAAANPHDLFVRAISAVATLHCGDLDDAARLMEEAVRLAPHDPDTRFFLTGLAMIHVIRGEHERALTSAARSLAINAHFDATYWMLIAANAFLGRMVDARRHLEALSAIAPGVTLSRVRAGQPAKHPDRIGAVLDGLRLAGMAEA
jgi:TolB-like protein/Flp pilus assembly protein TadD